MFRKRFIARKSFVIRKRFIGVFLATAVLLVTGQATAGVVMAAPGDISYTNANLNFSLTLPASWAGLYRADERTDGVMSGVSFIDVRNEKAGFGGFVFGIVVSVDRSPEEWTGVLLTQSGGKYYYSTTPSDVQFAYENKALTNEYNAMQKDIGSILKTFKLGPRVTAVPTAASVLVNGKNVLFDAYNIDGYNYFKLRDLAYTLSGSNKQFEIGWDAANNAISLTSGRPYTVSGGEMADKGSANKAAYPTSSKIYLDGKEVKFTAYNIDGYNYFKLRDIGQALNFGVDWDQAKQTITIDTSKAYTP